MTPPLKEAVEAVLRCWDTTKMPLAEMDNLRDAHEAHDYDEALQWQAELDDVANALERWRPMTDNATSSVHALVSELRAVQARAAKAEADLEEERASQGQMIRQHHEIRENLKEQVRTARRKGAREALERLLEWSSKLNWPELVGQDIEDGVMAIFADYAEPKPDREDDLLRYEIDGTVTALRRARGREGDNVLQAVLDYMEKCQNLPQPHQTAAFLIELGRRALGEGGAK